MLAVAARKHLDLIFYDSQFTSLFEKSTIEIQEDTFHRMNSKGRQTMLDLLELEQLAAFAEYGTLSKAAQELHISQPTLTRTM